MGKRKSRPILNPNVRLVMKMERASKAFRKLDTDFITIKDYRDSIDELKDFFQYLENRLLSKDSEEENAYSVDSERRLFP